MEKWEDAVERREGEEAEEERGGCGEGSARVCIKVIIRTPPSWDVEGVGVNSAVRVSAQRPSPLKECMVCAGTGHPGFPLSRRSRTNRRWKSQPEKNSARRD